MKKNLEYYLNLNYPIELIKISYEDGGGYSATIPMLGKYAFIGGGDTAEEAIESLNSIKKYLFEDYLSKGLPIIEPDTEDDEIKGYSGKFIVRIPAELHRFLAYEAKENNTTLNQYCIYLLTRKTYLSSIYDEISEMREDIKFTTKCINRINYSYSNPTTPTKLQIYNPDNTLNAG